MTSRVILKSEVKGQGQGHDDLIEVTVVN